MIVSALNLTSLKEKKITTAHLLHPLKNPMTINSLVYECKLGSVFQKEQKKIHQFNETKTLKSASFSSYTNFMDILNSNRKSTKTKSNTNGENKDKRYPRSTHEYEYQYGKQPNNNDETENIDPISQNNNDGSNREYMPSSNSSGTEKESHHDSIEECLYPLKFGSSREYSSYTSDFQNSDSSNHSTSSWKNNETVFWRTKSSLSRPPNIPFLPMFIGDGGNSIKSSKSVKTVFSAFRVAQIIAQEIQNPSSMPGQQTLNKFSILIQVLKTMSSKQMRDVTKEIYNPLSSTSSSSSPGAQNYISW